jgi:hypothetical protein
MADDDIVLQGYCESNWKLVAKVGVEQDPDTDTTQVIDSPSRQKRKNREIRRLLAHFWHTEYLT